jgi:3,4-dihydroxy 2-butanone 4-phosphate synthase/GTP cyclohydrolase II
MTAEIAQEQPAGRGREPGSRVFDGIALDDMRRAIADIAAGRAVVVVDDVDRENEGDLIFAASKATSALLAFTIRYTSGVICVPMLGEELDRLQLPLMTTQNSERMRTAFTVSVDARDGVTTGISAADRTRTVRRLVDSATEPYELVRPGHVFPLRYAPGGVLRRPGHTEAAVDLARLAGLPPAGVLAEVVNDDGTMTRLPGLRAFADEHGLALISIAQLIEYRRHSELMLKRVVETTLPNQYGQWRAIGYVNSIDGTEHLALVLGDLGPAEAVASTPMVPVPDVAVRGDDPPSPPTVPVRGDDPPSPPTVPVRGDDPPSPPDVLVRMHSECLTGDVFGSQRCDCGTQLNAAMATIAAEGRGIVLYLRGHEGRGIGLVSKLRAYQLQDGGVDTVDANTELGFPVDAREYSTGGQMLADLGVSSLRLLTNNPDKINGLADFGLKVTGSVSLPVNATPHNLRYLVAKRDRLGHLLELSDRPAASAQ